MYELVTRRHGTFGMAFSLSLLSLVSGRPPEAVYSAFAALIHVVLALTVFVLARIALGWSRRRSAVSSAVVAANAYLLFAAFYGWQPQLLLTAFGVLGLAGLYAALEGGPLPELAVIGGLGAAAGVCAYGAAFGPFVALGAVVIGAYVVLHRDRDSRQRAARVVAAITLLTILLGAVPIVRALLLTGRLAALSSNASLCAGCQAGLPSEALGLVPRIGEAARVSSGWSHLSLLVAGLLYLIGFAMARRKPGTAILVWGSGAALAAVVLLGLLSPNPYLSMKLAGYAAPLLSLTVVSGISGPARLTPRLGWYALVSVAVMMFGLSVAAVELRAARLALHSQAMAGLDQAARRLPPHAPVAIDVRDAWHQSWAIYYLRDRPLVIRHPQYFLSPAVAAAQQSSTRQVLYVLGRLSSGRVIWRGGGVVLSAARQRSASRPLES